MEVGSYFNLHLNEICFANRDFPYNDKCYSTGGLFMAVSLVNATQPEFYKTKQSPLYSQSFFYILLNMRMRFKRKQFLIKCLSQVTSWIIILDFATLFIQAFLEYRTKEHYDKEVFIVFGIIGIVLGILFPKYYRKKSGEKLELNGDEILVYAFVIVVWISIAWTSFTLLKVVGEILD